MTPDIKDAIRARTEMVCSLQVDLSDDHHEEEPSMEGVCEQQQQSHWESEKPYEEWMGEDHIDNLEARLQTFVKNIFKEPSN